MGRGELNQGNFGFIALLLTFIGKCLSPYAPLKLFPVLDLYFLCFLKVSCEQISTQASSETFLGISVTFVVLRLKRVVGGLMMLLKLTEKADH